MPGLDQAAAHWIDEATIAWPSYMVDRPEQYSFELWVGAHKSADLTYTPARLGAAQLENRRHLKDYLSLRVIMERSEIEKALKSDLIVAARDASGQIAAATHMQIPGVLDSLYAGSARERVFGVTFRNGIPTFRLWAPTARKVRLQLFSDDLGANPPTRSGEHASKGAHTPVLIDMERADDGTWETVGAAEWMGCAYRYEVEVYVPQTGKVERNVVTDPYSVGLSVNSTHSIVLDLNDPHYMPDMWLNAAAPTIDNPCERTIYELHICDFSMSDETVPHHLRGTYQAFALDNTNGVRHLRELAAAGMNTIHLLPSFDIATIEERRDRQAEPVIPQAGPASAKQQAAVMATADRDAYNWGYDPYHFTTPEGSYASDGNQTGGARTYAFRQMVGALHAMGFQVVLDQVFNHTACSGQGEKSVLDRIVPGYYHRLTPQGAVATSTCCPNVATEHVMAEKLMVDSVVTWARHYRVDGFRFDLMGHHSRANMDAVRAALNELTLEADGVDGSAIYIYGEGWNFGDDVQHNLRFTQATQGQLDGTGIGTFNDRLRDAVVGGAPFDHDKSARQGFATGQYTAPNALNAADDAELAALRYHQDLIRLSMAGNLGHYRFLASDGQHKSGAEFDFRGSPAGYASRPDETVNYVDAHDNETLFDIGVWKLPADTPMATRIRMNTVALATVMLGQSPAFWHAGTELLRSKSLDRNSYNSGDHFNRLDLSGRTHNFGVGLPPAPDNESQWAAMAPYLNNPANVASAQDIATARAQALDLLRLRRAHRLLTLGDADAICEKVSFPGAGPDQQAGLIIMRVDDTVGTPVDPVQAGLLVAINAAPHVLSQQIEDMAGVDLTLSPVHTNRPGADPVLLTTRWEAESGTLHVPPRSAVVLVHYRASNTPSAMPSPAQATEPPSMMSA
ncbi:pullulanase-type alpha-1,6-glucosidase [Trueperella bialowiezensis]|uniref:pullulanase-type alpha-1,6-glucosidase n=1 Tax=Trueperella bialowiezensis TaxID=312285 RepID=UPI0013DFCE5C|nr:pullulanase-type alpha-1,6-glucosidase [Trueperella bialowiezensis]